jgi:hypothetical protein
MESKKIEKHRESVRDIRNMWLSMGYDDAAIFSDVELVESIDTDEVTA